MARRMQVSVTEGGLNLQFEVSLENMATSEKDRPKIVNVHKGSIASLTTKYLPTDVVIKQGQTARVYVDANDNEIPKDEITNHVLNEDGSIGEEVGKVEQTKIFDVMKFIPMPEYNDTFIFEKYYELFPSNNGLKKDKDREVAMNKNHILMYELWEHLSMHHQAAMAEFNPTTSGFITGYGCIRPIYINQEWGLELGMFREKKQFQSLTKGKPQPITQTTATSGSPKNKLSMI